VNDLVEPDKVLEVTGGLLLLHGLGATAGPTLGGALMDLMGPESLMLYFAGVLVLLALCIWRYAGGGRVALAESASHKSDYVMMGGGSQAVLKMDPRRGASADAPTARR
jgi:predicted MFS family arabinose efflux permease